MERQVISKVIIIIIFLFTSCAVEKKNKVQYWVDRFCDCVNMPTMTTQVGCTDTWRTEMKKDLNKAEQKKCWDEIEKLKNGECSNR